MNLKEGNTSQRAAGSTTAGTDSDIMSRSTLLQIVDVIRAMQGLPPREPQTPNALPVTRDEIPVVIIGEPLQHATGEALSPQQNTQLAEKQAAD